MSILVTGATGFIGLEVVRLLAQEGDRPRVLVRRPARGLLFRGLDVEPVHGDLRSPESLVRAVTGVDAVIHLAARATFEEYRLLRSTIVDGSLSLAQAAATAGARTLVFGSSLFVHGDSPGLIDTDTPTDPQLGYGRAKVEAEEGLARIGRETGLRVTSIRLPHVYGARDLFFSRVPRGRLIVPGRRDNLFAHLHVHDAARVLVAAARGGPAGAWPVADHRATTWTEFFDTVRTYDPAFRYVRLPAAAARLGAALLRPFQRLSGQPTIMTAGSVVGWNLNLAVRPGVLWSDLGLSPRYPTIAQGIPAVLDDCVAFRWLHPLEDRRSGPAG